MADSTIKIDNLQILINGFTTAINAATTAVNKLAAAQCATACGNAVFVDEQSPIWHNNAC